MRRDKQSTIGKKFRLLKDNSYQVRFESEPMEFKAGTEFVVYDAHSSIDDSMVYLVTDLDGEQYGILYSWYFLYEKILWEAVK